MSRQDFIDQLKELGIDVQTLPEDRIAFSYEIPVGKFAGQTIQLGFVPQEDFPANPPASGPHISPRLLPLNNQSKTHPEGGIHDSPFGADWQYWSRPHNSWAKTGRSAKAYLAFIRLLFENQ